MVSSCNSREAYFSSSILVNLLEEFLLILVVIRITTPHSAGFGFEWLGEPTFRDIVNECSTGTNSYDQVTLVGEASTFSGDFASDVVLVVSMRDDQVYDHPNEDIPVMTSSPGRLLPHNVTSELVKLDLVKFQRRFGILDSI